LFSFVYNFDTVSIQIHDGIRQLSTGVLPAAPTKGAVIMIQLNRIFATLSILACTAIVSTTVFAENDAGEVKTVSSPHKREHGSIGKNAEARGKGDSEREAVEREHDADGAGSSRTANRFTAARPTTTPVSNIGSAPASTLTPIPVSALGSTAVLVPTSTLSTFTPSTLSSTISPAPVTATQPAAPAIDGAALYNSLCAGCHANAKRNRPVVSTQAAISGNVGGMGSLSYLTPAQLQAISAY
jgi:mono/diheme cytochrome c family protein